MHFPPTFTLDGMTRITLSTQQEHARLKRSLGNMIEADLKQRLQQEKRETERLREEAAISTTLATAKLSDSTFLDVPLNEAKMTLEQLCTARQALLHEIYDFLPGIGYF